MKKIDNELIIIILKAIQLLHIPKNIIELKEWKDDVYDYLHTMSLYDTEMFIISTIIERYIECMKYTIEQ